MKQWVKLDRELTDQDVGKRIRQRSTGWEHIVVSGNVGALLSADFEIEEEVASTQNLASGYAMWAGNSITIDPSSAAFRYYFNYGVPNNSVSPTPRHDCYLNGHSIVETGTLRSECRHCQQPAEWDRQSCSWVLKNANN